MSFLFVTLSASLAFAENWKEWELSKLIKVSDESNRVATRDLKEQLYLGYCYTKRSAEDTEEEHDHKNPEENETQILTEASVLWIEGNPIKDDLRIPYKGRASFGGDLERVKEKTKNFDFFDKQAALLKSNSPFIAFNKQENYWVLKNNGVAVKFVDGNLQQVDEYVVLWWASTDNNSEPELVGNWSRVYHDVNNAKAVSKTEALGYCHYPDALKFQ